MDIEIVLDGTRVVGASTKRQGAELIRIEEATRIADRVLHHRADLVCRTWNGDRSSSAWQTENKVAYEGMTITNTELQDVDE